MKSLIVFALFYLIPVNLQTQVKTEWIAMYNGTINGYDAASSMAVDSSGNIYVTGASKTSNFASECVTIKYDFRGVQQWIARYSSPVGPNNSANAIVADINGNVYITGISPRKGTGDDFVTIKYSEAGKEEWVRGYSGIGNGRDNAYAIALDRFGNVYVAGRSHMAGNNYDFAVVKYNSSGVEIWSGTYNGPGNKADFAFRIALDIRGNVYVTGHSYGGDSTNIDYALIKYDSSGTLLWVQRYNGPGNHEDWPSSLQTDVFGNVYVTGYSMGDKTGFDYATLKYNSSGAVQWVKRYSASDSSDEARSLAVDPLGNVYVTGESYTPETGFDYLTIKYDSSGAEQWVRRYSGTGNFEDRAYRIAIDPYRNIFITGCSEEGRKYEWVTIKYDDSGIEQWKKKYSVTSIWDTPSAIIVNGAGNIYLTGNARFTGRGDDFVTIKYTQ